MVGVRKNKIVKTADDPIVSGYSIPTLSLSEYLLPNNNEGFPGVPYETFFELYEKMQILLLRGKSDGQGDAETPGAKSGRFRWEDTSKLYEKISGGKDGESWTVENSAISGNEIASTSSSSEITPFDFLSAKGSDDETSDQRKKISEDRSKCRRAEGKGQRRGYCSFMVQHDREALRGLLSEEGKDQDVGKNCVPALPVPVLPIYPPGKISECPCLWIFFGRNPDQNGVDLPGRPEHTDAISHDGTWHFQMCGEKIWTVRPTMSLVRQWESHALEKVENDETRCFMTEDQKEQLSHMSKKITCQKGDILLINTALWFHSTNIPGGSGEGVSMSYARDIFLSCADEKDDDRTNRCDTGTENGTETAMTNLDGLYAADDIEEGTIIFTEASMPDCELPRHHDPNCHVVDLEDIGMMAVVSVKDIKAGEFFCVEETDDESEEDEDDEEGEE